MRRDNRADKIGGVTLLGVRRFGPRHNRHRDLGKVVEDDEIEIALSQKLRKREICLAPIARCSAYSNHAARPRSRWMLFTPLPK